MILYKVYYYSIAILLVTCTNKVLPLFDPITMVVGGLGAGAAMYYKLTYCERNECCNSKYVPAKIYNLKSDLRRTLFGQHLVQDILIPALNQHYFGMTGNSKPLVLSFHGTSGTGKNFVADRIAKYVYLKGRKSAYVHAFLGRAHFPLDSSVLQYQLDLERQLLDAVKQCPRSLFIFDEVDKMPVGIFDTVAKLLKNPGSTLLFCDSTFIFLTNSAGTEIADKLIELTSVHDVMRDNTNYHHFEEIAKMGAYNRTSQGLMQNMYNWLSRLIASDDDLLSVDEQRKSALIEATLIDYFIPFLPLERQHVEMCVKDEFRKYDIEPSAEQVGEVSSVVTYHKDLYAITGCKRIGKKVALAVFGS